VDTGKFVFGRSSAEFQRHAPERWHGTEEPDTKFIDNAAQISGQSLSKRMEHNVAAGQQRRQGIADQAVAERCGQGDEGSHAAGAPDRCPIERDTRQYGVEREDHTFRTSRCARSEKNERRIIRIAGRNGCGRCCGPRDLGSSAGTLIRAAIATSPTSSADGCTNSTKVSISFLVRAGSMQAAAPPRVHTANRSAKNGALPERATITVDPGLTSEAARAFARLRTCAAKSAGRQRKPQRNILATELCKLKKHRNPYSRFACRAL
jgi:hypothetical protein